MSTNDSQTLCSCPFCGGEAEPWNGAGPWHVVCTECGTFGGPCFSEAEATEAWNRRAAVTDQQFAYAVHDGRLWVCVGGALESDELKPIPGFTRDSIYRDSMREHGEWMGKATALMRDMWRTLSAMYGLNLGIDIGKERDYEERLREFGIGEEQ